MRYNFDLFKDKINLIIIVGFAVLPIILHCHYENFKQYEIYHLFYFLILQIIFLILILILSLIISYFFFKKKNIIEITITNCFIFYVQFYYNQIRNLKIIQHFENYHYLFDNLLSLIILLIAYFFIYYFLKNYPKKTKNFLLIFIIINSLMGIYNIKISKRLNTYLENYNSLTKINLDKISSINKNYSNIYLIILDGMVSLDVAKREEIISKREYKSMLKELDQKKFVYSSEFNSNYPFTDLSVKSLLYGDYPIDGNSEKIEHHRYFFPNIMKNKNNHFYQIINKLNINFFWIGNNFIPCDGKFDGECFYNYNDNYKYLTKAILSSQNLYHNSILTYLFRFYLNNSFITGYDFIKSKKKITKFENSNIKSNFFLIHVIKPHSPYTLNENCKEIIDVKLYDHNIDQYEEAFNTIDRKRLYGYQYKCIFNQALNWTKKIDNKNSTIIILGDHGWIFNRDIPKILQYAVRLDNSFFSYRFPKKCNSIEAPKSIVNIMRFILKCVQNSEISYLQDKQFVTRDVIRDKNDPEYGKPIELSEALNFLKE